MKKLNYFYFLSLIMMLLCSSCIGESGKVYLLGEIVNDQRNVPHFDAINVSSGIDVILNQGSNQKVIVKADKNVQDEIKTEVENNELKIYCTKNFWRVSNITVEITIRDLKHLKVNAGADVKSNSKLIVNDLTMEISGGSDININIEAQTLTLYASSGSDVNLEGNSASISIKSSSGSDINASYLKANEAVITTSSGSDVHVNAKSSIVVNASGGSDVYVTGKPQKQDISTSGGSDVYFH
jgi:hypothetical protein